MMNLVTYFVKNVAVRGYADKNFTGDHSQTAAVRGNAQKLYTGDYAQIADVTGYAHRVNLR